MTEANVPMKDLPPELRHIVEEVERTKRIPSNVDSFRERWLRHAARVRAELPDATVELDGATIHTGELSPGCRRCKEGAWDCIFVTMRCNLSCSFCCSPAAVFRKRPFSALGDTAKAMAANYERAGIKGISFTGGEPLLVPDVVLQLLAFFKQRFPSGYFWLYTNGIGAEGGTIDALAENGLDEMRFNMAATGYGDPKVLKALEHASRKGIRTTVEIPCMPDDRPKILAAIPDWICAGATHLNLHELMREAGSNSARLEGSFERIVLDDGHQTDLSVESRTVIFDIIREAHAHSWRISINDCSLQNKLRQIAGRRRNLAELTRAPQEKLTRDGRLESLYAFRKKGETLVFHPDRLPEMMGRYPDHTFFRARRRPPLALNSLGQWVSAEFMEPQSASDDAAAGARRGWRGPGS
jgi:uncharacterized protein